MARPKHADTRYLELKNGKYRVTVAVPRALQGKLGTKLKRPLNTDSRATANTLKWAVVAELKAIIDRAGREGKHGADDLFPEYPVPKRSTSQRERSFRASNEFTEYRRSVGVEEVVPGCRRSLVNFHSFRRYFITKAEQADQMEHIIAVVVGHKRTGMTLGRYSGGPLLEQARRCVEAVRLPWAPEGRPRLLDDITLLGAGEDGGEGGLRQGGEVAQIGERWSREGNQMATVNELRDALRDERARVADLRKRVQDNKYLRGCLTSASAVLYIVEHAISPATMAGPHVSSSPAWWLQQTADLLGGARAQVNFVEDLVAKFGDDVKSFPS